MTHRPTSRRSKMLRARARAHWDFPVDPFAPLSVSLPDVVSGCDKVKVGHNAGAWIFCSLWLKGMCRSQKVAFLLRNSTISKNSNQYCFECDSLARAVSLGSYWEKKVYFIREKKRDLKYIFNQRDAKIFLMYRQTDRGLSADKETRNYN